MEEEEKHAACFTTFQHYIGYSSHYIHTCIMHRGKKRETEIGYRETWNSNQPQSPWGLYVPGAPIHGTDIVRPHPMDDDEYDGYMQ